MMRRIVRLFLAASGLTAACAVVLFTEPVHACVTDSCDPDIRLFSRPHAPGNLVYFKLRTSEPGPLALRTKAGEPIAASIRSVGGDLVFAPDDDLPPGLEVELEYIDNCAPNVDAAHPRRFSFRTTEVVAPQVGTAAVTLAPGSEGGLWVTYAGAVQGDVAAHLLDVSWSVDGRRVQSGPALGHHLVATCQSDEDDSCGPDPGVYSPGPHTVEVEGTYVGLSLPRQPSSLDVRLACTEAARSAGALDTDDELHEPVASTAGCSLTRHIARSGLGTSLLALLAMVLGATRAK
jgi:hypothetical protein